MKKPNKPQDKIDAALPPHDATKAAPPPLPTTPDEPTLETATVRSSRSAQWVAAGIFLSRISGLVREHFFARFLGAGLYADVFRAALRGPNFLQNLLGEGTLSASFIPVYAKLVEQGKHKEAGKVAGAILALLIALAGVLTLVGIAIAPLLVTVFYHGFTGEKRALTITCTRIIFPMTGVLALSAWALAILNSHRRFFLSYTAPVVWNAALIATLIFFAGQPKESLVEILAWGAVIGGVLQFLVQLPGVLRVERKLKVRLNLKLPGVRETTKNALPAISGRGVVQISGYVDTFLASFMGNGAVALLGFAQTLYLLPVSLFGMSVAASQLPELSRERDAAVEMLARRINGGLEQIAVLVMPAVLGYLVLGDIVVAALYESGEFTARDTRLVTLILGGYTIGLLASTATRMFSSAFFALQDTRTPARIAYVRVALSGLIGAAITLYVKYYPEHRQYGPVGLALAAGIAAWVEWFLLRRKLHARLPGVGLGRVLLTRLFAVALAAALIARGIDYALPAWNHLIVAAIVLGSFMAMYLIAMSWLGIETNLPLIGRFFRRRRA